jgi:hypothetical protein
MAKEITRRHGGQINPEFLQSALLTIPGILSDDKMELARTLNSVIHSSMEQTFGDQATRYEKVCYVVAVSAAMTLVALKEFDETDDAAK